MTSVVADRGQVTIPMDIRRRLGIKPRTILDFHEENGKLVAVKVTRKDPVDRIIGCLKLDRKVDAIISELRGER